MRIDQYRAGGQKQTLCSAWAFAFLGLLAFSTLSLGSSSPVPDHKPEAYPSWWFERDVILRNDPTRAPTTWPTDYPLSDDYAALNLGQLKTIASMAYEELRARLPEDVWVTTPETASGRLTTLIEGWRQPQSLVDDYAVANLGQLKHVASHFYDFLRECGYVSGPNARPLGWLSGSYPWTGSTTPADDYAVANIGQAKYLFSFDLSPRNGQIPDWWVFYYFETPDGFLAENDSDRDGVSNLGEFEAGTSPIDFFNGDPVNLIIDGGDKQSGPSGRVLDFPLTVKVEGSNTVYGGVPVVFRVLNQGGKLSATSVGQDLVEMKEDLTDPSTGKAGVFFIPEGGGNKTVTVEATIAVARQFQTVIFEATVTPSEVPTVRFGGDYSLRTLQHGAEAAFPITVNDPQGLAQTVQLYSEGGLVASSEMPASDIRWTPDEAGRFPLVVRLTDVYGRTSSDAIIVQVVGSGSDSAAYSPASGGMGIEILSESDTVTSLPFDRASVFVGRVGQATPNSIKVTEGGWTPGAFAPADTGSYLLEILTGSGEGIEVPIIGNTRDTLDLVAFPSGVIPNVGCRFAIRPAWSPG